MFDHGSPEVRQALIRLDDALCEWERSTGQQSVLILREQSGFVHRSVSGKPNVPFDVTDAELLATHVDTAQRSLKNDGPADTLRRRA